MVLIVYGEAGKLVGVLLLGAKKGKPG